MTGSRRSRAVGVTIAVAGTAAAVALLLGPGSSLRACTTVGYANVSAIEIESEDDVDALHACFGPACSPAPVDRRDDGPWVVPQEPPFLQGATQPGSLTHVTVRAESAGAVVVDGVFAIESRPAGGWGLRSECPGPRDYLPVAIG